MDDALFLKYLNEKKAKAYHHLYKEMYAYLVVFCKRYVYQQDLAEDLVQEVFISIWEGEKTFSSYINLKGFLYESVRNRALNYLKHKQVESKYHSYIQQFEMPDEADTEYDLMREEIIREFYDVVATLPERCRQIFKLYLQGKKTDEIADMLKLSVETVRTQRKYGLRTLRERLSDLYILVFIFGLKI